MLTRRHIRVKVMQSVYALLQSKSDDLVREEKYLYFSLAKSYDLYVLMLDLMVQVQKMANEHLEIGKKKHLATSEDRNPNRKFVENKVLNQLRENSFIAKYCEENKLENWKDHTEYVRLILDEIKASTHYKEYISSGDSSYKEDKEFVISIFKEVIAPNDKLLDYFESENLSWVDDYPMVNTYVVKRLNKLNETKYLKKQALYKDEEDEQFVSDLLKKVALHHDEFTQDIDTKTPNWDADRIAEIDLILMKMALTEFVYFPSIPVRVTINEYLEIAKDYSTAKSSFFINGVLDKLSKEYLSSHKIEKVGRGLR